MTTFSPPSREALKARRLAFLQASKPNLLRDYEAKGELEKHLNHKAKVVADLAAELVSSGEPVQKAWEQAIQEELLENFGG
jgi:hypothetical protein